MRTAVIALGGNALVEKNKTGNIPNQFKTIKKALVGILPLIRQGYSIAITHGNGLQVGNILIRVEEAKGKAYDLPLHICVAESQGELGYMIGQSLINILNKSSIYKDVACMLTQVIVNKNDPALKLPTKPIGPFYKNRALLNNRDGQVIEDSGRGFRRVVPSPKPRKIVEANTISNLLSKGVIVIAAGGGGIPVCMDRGRLMGIDAVIDKDLASACLAKELGAELLLILTGIDKVALNFNKPTQKFLKRMTLKDAEIYLRQGHFPPGSMGPKIEAAINFLKSGGKKVIITSPSRVSKALRGKDGTIITKAGDTH